MSRHYTPDPLAPVNTGTNYKRSLFDRLGPEASNIINLVNWSLAPAIGGGLVAAAVASRAHLPTGLVIAIGLLGALTSSAATILFGLAISRGAGGATSAFTAGTDSTPYPHSYSREESLAVRGNVDEALDLYEAAAVKAPGDISPLIRAAELCIASGGREPRAETLLRSIQRVEGVSMPDDVHASNRLVDLYLSWPGNETKALRELRRLIDLYPGTGAEKNARSALTNLKKRFPA